jgi:hypothetical protein
MLQLVKATLTLDIWVKIRDWSDAEIQDWLKQRFGHEAGMIMQSPEAKQQVVAQYGAEKWMSVSREALQFEADVGVVPGSARPRTMEADRQQALLFMRALAELGGVMPMLLTSRRFIQHMAELFELGDELLIDEIITSVQKQMQMMQQQASAKAGAPGGNGQMPSPAQMQGQPPIASRLQTAMINGGF